METTAQPVSARVKGPSASGKKGQVSAGRKKDRDDVETTLAPEDAKVVDQLDFSMDEFKVLPDDTAREADTTADSRDQVNTTTTTAAPDPSDVQVLTGPPRPPSADPAPRFLPVLRQEKQAEAEKQQQETTMTVIGEEGVASRPAGNRRLFSFIGEMMVKPIAPIHHKRSPIVNEPSRRTPINSVD